MPGKATLVLKSMPAEARRALLRAGQRNAARDVRMRLEFRLVAERFIRWRTRQR